MEKYIVFTHKDKYSAAVTECFKHTDELFNVLNEVASVNDYYRIDVVECDKTTINNLNDTFSKLEWPLVYFHTKDISIEEIKTRWNLDSALKYGKNVRKMGNKS